MTYILDHTNFHFGIIELIGLLFMIGIIVVVWRKLKKLKDAQQDLESQLSELNAKDIVELADNIEKKAVSELDATLKE